MGSAKIGCKIDEVRVDGSLRALARDLRTFSVMGLDAVEIPPHGLDVIKCGRLDPRRSREVRRILEDFDFTYTLHAPNPLNLMDRTQCELHVEVLRATLEFAEYLGASPVVVHCGRYVPEEGFGHVSSAPPSEADCRAMRDQERYWLDKLAGEFPAITIGVENARPYCYYSPYAYGESLRALKAQVEAVGRPNVGITLDIGHAHMSAGHHGWNFLEEVADVAERVRHVHIHDNFGGSVAPTEKQQTHQIPFGRGDNHMPVGWGGIPMKAVLSLLMPAYTGIFMMELRSRYFDYIEESKWNLECLLEGLAEPRGGSVPMVFAGA